MILHVVGNHLYVWHLRTVYNALANTEENRWLQVGGSSWLYISLAFVAIIKCFLQVRNLTIFVGELCILTTQVVTQAVDLGIKTVNFRLVAQFGNCLLYTSPSPRDS